MHLPGSLGGQLSNPAVAGNNVYVATVDLPFALAKLSYPLGAPDGDGTGEAGYAAGCHYRL